MTNEQKIKEACIKANPEIMELKFGCEVIVNLSYTDKHAMITRCLDTQKQMFQWIELPWQEAGIKPEYCTDKSKMEILGRPIHLADVLLAIDKTDDSWSMSCFGYFEQWKVETDKPDIYKLYQPNIKWNLRKDSLSDQTEQTKQFLAELLTNSK